MTERQDLKRARVAAIAFALSATFPMLCAGQNQQPPPPDPLKAAPPKVYSNPRAGADDPRIGLKPGLYDAGEAIFGLQKIASIAKPPGFAAAPATTPAPEPPPEANAAGRGGRGPTLDTGSVNS